MGVQVACKRHFEVAHKGPTRGMDGTNKGWVMHGGMQRFAQEACKGFARSAQKMQGICRQCAKNSKDTCKSGTKGAQGVHKG